MEYQIKIRNIESVRVAYLHYQGVASEANGFFLKFLNPFRERQTEHRFSITI